MTELSQDDEDRIEAAFWVFDAERKKTGAERDAFKHQLRPVLRERNRAQGWARLWKRYRKLERRVVLQALRILGAVKEPDTIGSRLRNYLFYQHALLRMHGLLKLLDRYPETAAEVEQIMAEPPELRCEKCLTNEDWQKAYNQVKRELDELKGRAA